MYQQLDKLALAKLIKRWQAAPLPEQGEEEGFDPIEQASLYYNEVAYRIVEKGQQGAEFLFNELKTLNKTDVDRLQAIIYFLPKPEHPIPSVILLAYLKDTNPIMVTRAIEGLAFQGQKDAIKEVLALRTNPDQYIRGAVLSFMEKLYPEQAIPMAIEALQDSDEVVRSVAIDVLDDLEAVETLEYIRPFLNDTAPHVREAAEWAVNHFEEVLNETKTVGT